MRIKRAEKYGFCAGVRIADRKVKRFAREGHRGEILGQVVHNERVVEEMEELGVGTVQTIGQAQGDTLIFSAHGVPPSFHEAARSRGLRILDTTCPFVYDIHDEAKEALDAGTHLVFIGDPRHREVVGYTRDLDPATYHVLMSVEEARAVDWSSYRRVKIFYQTTLNAEDFEELARFIEGQVTEAARADTICYATKENQDAAHALGRDPDIGAIVVIGGRESANTRHLWEICQRYKPSYLIQGAADLRPEWVAGIAGVGLTAGASTPDYVIDEVESALTALAVPASA